MRHGIAGNKLNRNKSHRQATVRDIAKATLIQERVTTTKAKAKEARKLVDQLITLGKKGTLAHKRRAFSILCDHKIVSDLFKHSGRFKGRNGGYTRIIPLGTRRGDSAQLVLLELTEKKELTVTPAKTTASAKKSELEEKPAKEKKDKKEKSKAKPEAKDAVKDQTPKDAVKEDQKIPAKQQDSKQKFSGIRKMFKRKSSGK